MELTFVDHVPPRRTRAKYDYDYIAERLREHPGQWARCFRDAPDSLRLHLLRGIAALPLDQFEIKTETKNLNSERRFDIYLMYRERARGVE